MNAPRGPAGVRAGDDPALEATGRAATLLEEPPRQPARTWPHLTRVGRGAGPLPSLLGAGAGGLFLAFLLLPVVALVLHESPGQLFAALAGPDAVPSLLLSGETTVAALGLTIACGLPLAYVLARVRFPGRGIVETLVTLPTVLPPAVAGVALLVAFGRQGLVGHWLAAHVGVDLAFTTVAVVMAQVFVAAPYFINAARSAIAQLDPSFEEAAAVDGATRAQTLARVTVPLVAPALFSGAAMTWARALGEFGATIIFAGSFPARTETAPLAIYFAAESNFETAIALGVVLLAVSFAVLLTARFLRPETERPASSSR